MRITQVFGDTSKNAASMRWDFNHYPRTRNICSAYDRPSQTKIDTYQDIINDYTKNGGLHAIQVKRQFKSLQYNNDIRVTAVSSHFYSTIASFTDTETGDIWLIKETHANTYACKLTAH